MNTIAMNWTWPLVNNKRQHCYFSSRTMTVTSENPAQSKHADWHIIQRILQGDKNFYGELIQQYQEMISLQMWRFSRVKQQHEELVQDVFVEAYLHLHKYQGQAPFEHWLRVIAVRIGYRFWKTRYQAQKEISFDRVQSVLKLTRYEEGPSQTDAAELVHQLLNQLPPRDRLVLSMFYLEEESIEKTAQLLGWSKTMTKVQLHRARKKMEALLQQSK